ncbi:MAG: FKBP-type peptidyl-prolyl cis-trans isomerase [Pseudomonadota bacterium]
MHIARGTLVSLQVKMFDAQGNLLEASEAPLVYLHGANDIFPAVEQALEGKAAGDEVSLRLEPEQAFGAFDAQLVHVVERARIGRDVTAGMQVEGLPGVAGDTRIYRVTDVAENVAVLDGNHPLAGMALRFDIKVLGVEAASAQELAQAEAPQVPDFLRPLAPHDLHGGGGAKQ